MCGPIGKRADQVSCDLTLTPATGVHHHPSNLVAREQIVRNLHPAMPPQQDSNIIAAPHKRQPAAIKPANETAAERAATDAERIVIARTKKDRSSIGGCRCAGTPQVQASNNHIIGLNLEQVSGGNRQTGAIESGPNLKISQGRRRIGQLCSTSTPVSVTAA